MRECQNCGGGVTPDFARVFGDNSDRVYDCPTCAPITDWGESRLGRSSSVG